MGCQFVCGGSEKRVLFPLTYKVLFAGEILTDTTTMGADGRRVVLAVAILTLELVNTCDEAINTLKTKNYVSGYKG